jgi:hypothetical protein
MSHASSYCCQMMRGSTPLDVWGISEHKSRETFPRYFLRTSAHRRVEVRTDEATRGCLMVLSPGPPLAEAQSKPVGAFRDACVLGCITALLLGLVGLRGLPSCKLTLRRDMAGPQSDAGIHHQERRLHIYDGNRRCRGVIGALHIVSRRCRCHS